MEDDYEVKTFKLMLRHSLFNMEKINNKDYICLTVPDFDFYYYKYEVLDLFEQFGNCDILRVKSVDNEQNYYYQMFSLNKEISQETLVSMFGGEGNRCYYCFDNT